MHEGISGTRVLVTGASAGIGRALAVSLAERGATVWGVARSRERLAGLASELGSRFRYSVADQSQPSDVARVVAELDAARFLPDTVVLNAGISTHDADDDFSFRISNEVLATNLTGVLAFVDPLLSRLLERGSGQFIAVASIFALRPDPVGVGYAASKAGLAMAFRSLAIRYRRTPIRFKTLLLGPITTPGPGRAQTKRFAPHLKSPDDAAEAIQAMIVRSRPVVYYPPLVGWAMRATSLLPDAMFDDLTRPLRR